MQKSFTETDSTEVSSFPAVKEIVEIWVDGVIMRCKAWVGKSWVFIPYAAGYTPDFKYVRHLRDLHPKIHIHRNTPVRVLELINTGAVLSEKVCDSKTPKTVPFDKECCFYTAPSEPKSGHALLVTRLS